MSDNRSLDEFAGGGSSSDGRPEPDATDDDGSAEDTDGRGGGAETEATESPGSEVAPMAETYAWSASGGTCGSCGERATERWRDDDALVCADCKAW